MSKFLNEDGLTMYHTYLMDLITIDSSEIEFDTDYIIDDETSAVLGEAIIGTLVLGKI